MIADLIFQVSKCDLSASSIGDGFCDDANNVEGCLFDNGDCCNNPNPDWDKYCLECTECIIETKVCWDSWINDRYCNDHNNKFECRFDGDDCCNNPNANKNKYCDNCEQCVIEDYLSNSNCVDLWVQDTYCDDQNNNVACKFDGGDCCNNANANKTRYCGTCKECAILDETPCVYNWIGDGFCDDETNV